jgi:hypothetical protein
MLNLPARLVCIHSDQSERRGLGDVSTPGEPESSDSIQADDGSSAEGFVYSTTVDITQMNNTGLQTADQADSPQIIQSLIESFCSATHTWILEFLQHRRRDGVGIDCLTGAGMAQLRYCPFEAAITHFTPRYGRFPSS